MQKVRPLKIMWVSNAPWCGTGYGIQASKIIPFLKDRPEVEDVSLFAFYGIQGAVTKQLIGRHWVTCYPLGIDPYGNDMIEAWVKDFDANVVITLVDIFILKPDYGTQGFFWLPYAPIDHDPIPAPFIERFRNAYRPIVYSHFAVKKMKEAGLECWYAPHGVETDIFRIFKQDERRKAREWLGLEPDSFIVGMVAANKDPHDRKGFNEAMAAFRNLIDIHPDSQMYIHSLVTPEMGGYDLVNMAKVYGIGHRARFTLREVAIRGLCRRDLARLYSAFDIFLNPCHRAGFEIPLVEAQACGVPVICGDWHSMAELCGAGWLIKPAMKQYSPLGGFVFIPDVNSITDCLLDAYDHKRDPKHITAARDFSMEYSWKQILPKFWGPIIANLDQELEIKHRQPSPVDAIRMRLNPATEVTLEGVRDGNGL